MPEKNPVSVFLTQHGIPHRVFRHETAVRNIEEAAIARGQKPEQVIRSILFRLEEGVYVLVLIAGTQQVSWQALRHYLGRSRLTLATHEEVLTVTGYAVGTVSPIGLPASLRILADKGIFAYPEVSFGAGEANTAIIMKREDFKGALGDVEIGEFALPES
jgi:prolyl-tRNA editing enzyme YbaK/EbsC (Cys-tRNA(Pro) deacylase)